MKIESIEQAGFEEVWRATDPAASFTAYIALHNMKRGPALGGVRFWTYLNESEAVADVCRLAESMTYKSAVANLAHGGGKGVIVRPTGDFDRTKIMSCFGDFIEHLQGRYITAKDVGTTGQDMVTMKRQTRYVTGLPPESGGAGDPSPLTAAGVMAGLKVSITEKLGHSELKGLRVAIQGLGGVGIDLARQLSEAGCEVWGSDVDPKKLVVASQQFGVHSLLPEMIFTQEVDIFSPCALGQVLSAENIPQLKCQIVAGAANDTLASPEEDATALQARAILYAPDFVINAGGLIHVASEWEGYDSAKASQQIQQIGATLKEIYAHAATKKTSTHAAALAVALSRL